VTLFESTTQFAEATGQAVVEHSGQVDVLLKSLPDQPANCITVQIQNSLDDLFYKSLLHIASYSVTTNKRGGQGSNKG
jgi:hypothetical protein